MARPVPAAIREYARRLGLDPRAVEAVSHVESGLRRGAVGDQGTSFGPFQLHVGGALPRGRNAAWAGSDAGIFYAMQQMARVARGMTGKEAVANIVKRFERPADPNTEITRAWDYYSSGRGGHDGSYDARSRTAPKGYSRFSIGGGGGGQDTRRQLFNYALAANQAFVSGSEAPNLASFINAVETQSPDVQIPSGLPSSQAMKPKGTYGGAKGAKAMIAVIREAERRGLHVSENPFVDKVDPVHTSGSDHYQVYPGGRVGKASDVSGRPAAMGGYFDWLYKNRGRLGVDDLFYDPKGRSLDEGKPWNKTIGGHSNHVHVSLF